jgi:catechol 2,3-dioxygenase-like lactoylglutathione lyase family enzyme
VPTYELVGVVLDAPDAQQLGAFYQRMTGWVIRYDEPGWYKIVPTEDADCGVSFQNEPEFVPPVWPSDTTHQQMQLHLDLLVDDLPAACARAEECGARLAEFQPQDAVRVYLDPVGHPFCLFELGG